MAIGSLIGAAVIGGVAKGLSGGSGAGKAQQALDASSAQAAQVQQNIYNSNSALLSPLVQQGQQATGAINALLGLTPTNQPLQAAPQANAPATPFEFVPGGGFEGIRNGFGSILQRMQARQNGQPGQNGQVPQQANYLTPQQAFDNYRNSTGYQFRFNQGMNALNSGYAGAGSIKSGAAMKASQEFGQGIASAEFGNYLNSLGNQQNVGLGAGSALAGVGTNYANSLGNIYQQQGTNQANAALASAQNKNNLIGSVIGGIGMLGGLFG